MANPKWTTSTFGTAYPESIVPLNDVPYDNVCFSTNMFSKKFDSYYLDENGEIIHEIINPATKHDALKDCTVVKIDGICYGLFENEYLKTIKRKKYADINKSLATFNISRVDNNRLAFICFTIINTDKFSKISLIKVANRQIKKLIDQYSAAIFASTAAMRRFSIH